MIKILQKEIKFEKLNVKGELSSAQQQLAIPM